MSLKGIGKIKVTSKPKRIPKSIKLGNKRFKVDPNRYKVIWIERHLAKGERARLRKKFKMRK